jgi:hypothetical protein
MDEDIIKLTTTAVGEIEQKLAFAEAIKDPFVAELANQDLVLLAGCSLATSPGENDNWVEKAGGLPEYICEIARAIKRSGKTTSRAIAIAVGQVKNWAHGKGEVDADTRAKAAKALAQWSAMKAKAKVT